MMKLYLLTAQRRDKIATMGWDDVKDGVWNIDTEEREKGNAGKLALPQVALDLIEAQPRFANNPYVFAGSARGRRSRGPLPFSNWSMAKQELDAKLNFSEPWTIHDLRRTARSLMSKAGVTSEVAERVLGHTIGGVEGIYMACRLLQREPVRREIEKRQKARLRTLVPKAVDVLEQILDTPEHKDRLKAVGQVLNRVDPAIATTAHLSNVNVTVRQESADELALKALRLLREIGASRAMMEKVLGANGLPLLEERLDGRASNSKSTVTIEAVPVEVLDDSDDDGE
jgi:hypothetical protein